MTLKEENLINFFSVTITILIHLVLFLIIISILKFSVAKPVLIPVNIQNIKITVVGPEKKVEIKKIVIEKIKLNVETKRKIRFFAKSDNSLKKELPKVKVVSLKNAKKDSRIILTEPNNLPGKKSASIEKLVEKKSAADNSKNSLGLKSKDKTAGVNMVGPAVYLPGDNPNAKVISIAKPVYPKDALNNDWAGTLKVRIIVNVEGKPKNITIIKSSGYKVLDEAFIKAISNYKFKPKIVSGIAKEDKLELEYTFSLN
ncbi:MAG: TonB family protein [Candidatus Margulisiibacteriota bacterium]|jgi:TonB family protein